MTKRGLEKGLERLALVVHRFRISFLQGESAELLTAPTPRFPPISPHRRAREGRKSRRCRLNRRPHERRNSVVRIRGLETRVVSRARKKKRLSRQRSVISIHTPGQKIAQLKISIILIYFSLQPKFVPAHYFKIGLLTDISKIKLNFIYPFNFI